MVTPKLSNRSSIKNVIYLNKSLLLKDGKNGLLVIYFMNSTSLCVNST